MRNKNGFLILAQIVGVNKKHRSYKVLISNSRILTRNRIHLNKNVQNMLRLEPEMCNESPVVPRIFVESNNNNIVGPPSLIVQPLQDPILN